MDKIEEIFDEIIKEAAIGRIDCDFFMPICFNTVMVEGNSYKEITVSDTFNNTMLPTVIIKDKEKLINSISDYIEVAKSFYNNDKRVNDTSCPEKYIISSLLSNTLTTDFNDLDRLFRRGKSFILDESLSMFDEVQNIGYSSVLKSNIMVQRNKQSIAQETPYGIDIHLEDNDGSILYKFPTIRYGVDEDKVYIYSIQGDTTLNNNKKIERVLRKVGEGFDEKNENRDPVENPENLYSINPWSLVALSIFIPLIQNDTSINKIVAPYFLVHRYNAIEVSYAYLKEKYKDIPLLLSKKEEQVNRIDEIQRNITDKFLRTFRRLDHHFSNINITSFELDMDGCLHLQTNDEYSCNNTLLNDVYTIANDYNSKNKSI